MPNNQITEVPGNGQLFETSRSFYSPLPATSTPGYTRVENYKDDQQIAVRFSMLDKKLKLTSDSLVPNNKTTYSIQPDQFTFFQAHNNNYMLVAQRFLKKSNGLLLVSNNDEKHLHFRDLIVNDWNNYLVSLSKIIPEKGIIMPFIHKQEAGLIKITME